MLGIAAALAWLSLAGEGRRLQKKSELLQPCAGEAVGTLVVVCLICEPTAGWQLANAKQHYRRFHGDSCARVRKACEAGLERDRANARKQRLARLRAWRSSGLPILDSEETDGLREVKPSIEVADAFQSDGSELRDDPDVRLRAQLFEMRMNSEGSAGLSDVRRQNGTEVADSPRNDLPDDLGKRLRAQLPEYDSIERSVTEAVKQCYVNFISIQPFGSLVNGFGSNTSDLDLCILVSSDFDIALPENDAVDHAQIFNRVFLQELMTKMLPENESLSSHWKLLDDGKLRAKVPTLTFRYADTVDVDISVNQDVTVLNQQTRNLFFLSRLPLKEDQSVADLWRHMRKDFADADLLGANFDPRGTMPRRFPSFRLLLLLLEFFIAHGHVSLENDTLTASADQRAALQSLTTQDLQLDFYKWCRDSRNLSPQERMLAFIQKLNNVNRLHIFDPWNKDTRHVVWTPFRGLFDRRIIQLQDT